MGFKRLAGTTRNTLMGRSKTRFSAVGTPLPPTMLRMGGHHFTDDAAFVKTAVDDVRRLETHGLTSESRLLDWGCGAGRLAVGVRERFGRIGHYHGVDVQQRLIKWAQTHLAGPGYEFTFVDLANARYNPEGRMERSIPGDSGAYDVLYAYSVFSHMLSEDAKPYLAEIRRLLAQGGVAWFTAFVEDGVAEEAENPPDYGPFEWRLPLHCVRYDREYFQGMIEEAGLVVDTFEHGRETDGQSLFVVRPPLQRSRRHAGTET